ncbi:MAG TPA: hypothetical protein VGA29_05340 [Ignavibacteriaceae bacterium]
MKNKFIFIASILFLNRETFIAVVFNNQPFDELRLTETKCQVKIIR